MAFRERPPEGVERVGRPQRLATEREVPRQSLPVAPVAIDTAGPVLPAFEEVQVADVADEVAVGVVMAVAFPAVTVVARHDGSVNVCA